MKKEILLIFLLHFFGQSIYASSMQEVFTQVYEQGHWFCEETFSGPGSRLIETSVIRKELPNILKQIEVKILLDVGCGDFNWLKVTELPVKNYIGVDIVPSLIQNNKKYENEERKFFCLNAVEDQLPRADAILCRDVLNHLSLQDIKKTIKNFKRSGSRYFIITMQAIPINNLDIAATGLWRPLNFLYEPFNFPQPKYLIHEGDYQASTGKSLAVWLLDDIDIEDESNKN